MDYLYLHWIMVVTGLSHRVVLSVVLFILTMPLQDWFKNFLCLCKVFLTTYELFCKHALIVVVIKKCFWNLFPLGAIGCMWHLSISPKLFENSKISQRLREFPLFFAITLYDNWIENFWSCININKNEEQKKTHMYIVDNNKPQIVVAHWMLTVTSCSRFSIQL